MSGIWVERPTLEGLHEIHFPGRRGKTGGRSPDIPLQAGDRIYVYERIF